MKYKQKGSRIIRLQPFFYKFKENLVAIFSGYNLLWHVIAISLAYFLVVSGFDWFYFMHTRNSTLFMLSIPVALLGFITPVFTPIILLIAGSLRKNKKMLNAGYALAQSALVAWLISSAYKAITGRVHPELFGGGAVLDISRVFRFGFFRGGIFWGWPSSHTMVAFAIAAAAIILFPNFKIKLAALAFALYVGVSVSLTIHWFSDFAAGAILGAVTGLVIGSAFKARYDSSFFM